MNEEFDDWWKKQVNTALGESWVNGNMGSYLNDAAPLPADRSSPVLLRAVLASLALPHAFQHHAFYRRSIIQYRWDVTHPAAFLWVAPASCSTVPACTRLVKLPRTLQTQKETEVTKPRCGNIWRRLLLKTGHFVVWVSQFPFDRASCFTTLL